MGKNRPEIVPIHGKDKLQIIDYGAKAVQLRELVRLGGPVPEGFLISKDLVNEVSNEASFEISKSFKNLEGLYALRASPIDRTWGSVEAILNLGC